MHDEDCSLPMDLHVLNLSSLFVNPVYWCLGPFSCYQSSFHSVHTEDAKVYIVVLIRDESGTYTTIDSPDAYDIL